MILSFKDKYLVLLFARLFVFPVENNVDFY